MLDRLKPQSPDALLALIKLHAADDRPDKVDLGVGVYRTGQGATPVFGAIVVHGGGYANAFHAIAGLALVTGLLLLLTRRRGRI